MLCRGESPNFVGKKGNSNPELFAPSYITAEINVPTMLVYDTVHLINVRTPAYPLKGDSIRELLPVLDTERLCSSISK
jgi:hypothetical protein